MKKIIPVIIVSFVISFSFIHSQNQISLEQSKVVVKEIFPHLISIYSEWQNASISEAPTIFNDLYGIPFVYLYEIDPFDKQAGYCGVSAYDDLPFLNEASAAASPIYNIVHCKNVLLKQLDRNDEVKDLTTEFISTGFGLYYIKFSFKDNSFFYNLKNCTPIDYENLRKQQNIIDQIRVKKAEIFKKEWEDILVNNSFKKTSAVSSSNQLNVSGFNWYRGCVPTSQAMIFKYIGSHRSIFSNLNCSISNFSWTGPTNWTTTGWISPYNPSNSQRHAAKSLVDRFADYYGFPSSGNVVGDYGVDAPYQPEGFTYVASSYGYSFEADKTSPSSSKVKKEIDNYRPLKGGFVGDSYYGSHAICIIGYTGSGSMSVFWDTYQYSSTATRSTSSFDNLVRVFPGIKVPEDVATIGQALTLVEEGERIIVNSGTYNESLTITKDDITIIGDGKSSTFINGTVTFQDVSNCVLEYLSVNGEIHINSGDHNKVSQVNTEERIVYSYGNNHYLDVVTANHGDKYGVKAYNTNTLFIDDFTSTESSKYGIYANNNSNLDIETDPNYYPYKIKDKTYALQLTSYSEASLEYVRFEQNDYDIYAATTTSAIACNCTFTVQGQNYGAVSIDDPQWCDGTNALQSSHNTNLSKNSASNIENSSKDFDDGLSIFMSTNDSVKATFLSDKDYQSVKYLSDYQEAIDKFKKVISEYSDIALANRALSYISWCYWNMNQFNELEEYLKNLADNKKYNGEMNYHARILLASINVHKKEYIVALEQYDGVLKDCQIEDILVEALYGKGVIYCYFTNDKEKAVVTFKEILDKYPAHPTSEAAQDELVHLDVKYESSIETDSSPEFTSQNYPNPFNPETTISYTIPEDGKVILRIYDIRGREVANLVNAEQLSGRHRVIWNGKDHLGRETTSGMYFYRIHFKNRIFTGKMVLVH